MPTGVLFIHGLGGDGIMTWGKFPELLKSDPDLDGFSYETFEYPTPKGFSWLSVGRDIETVATRLDSYVTNSFGHCDDIVLVCHSLGGLVARQYLLTELEANRPSKIRRVVFFGTPHGGSEVASVVKSFPGLPKQVKELVKDSATIRMINDAWVARSMNLRVETHCVYADRDEVVSEGSTLIVCEERHRIFGTHRSMVKPETVLTDTYKVLKSVLLRPRELLKNLKQKANELAEQTISRKAALVSSRKPELLQRTVHKHSPEIRPARGADGKLSLELLPESLPLQDFQSTNQLNFLFGELGSGKSTLLAEFAKSQNNLFPQNLALFLQTSELRDIDIRSDTDLLDILEQKFANLFGVRFGVFNLLYYLQQGVRLAVLLDGFDELNHTHAFEALNACVRLTNKYTSVTCIASGRPIELAGLDYSQWQLLMIDALKPDDTRQLLLNESISAIPNREEAEEDAKKRNQILLRSPDLRAVTATPLMVRLLWPYLEGSYSDETVGSLLYNLLSKRLGTWDTSEFVQEPLALFNSHYPNAASREPIVSAICRVLALSNTRQLSREAIHQILVTEIDVGEVKQALIEECIVFMQRNLLEVIQGEFTMAYQPLLQVAHGMWYFYHANERPSEKECAVYWREFAFTAAIARKKATMETVRDLLDHVIAAHTKRGYITSLVSQIALESKDIVIIKHLLFLPSARFRPFGTGGEEGWDYTFARLIHANDDEGFKWFYHHYLDPKYPLVSWDETVAHPIFARLAELHSFTFSNTARDLILEMSQYIKAFQDHFSHSYLTVVCACFPDEFNENERVSYLLQGLDNDGLRDRCANLLASTITSAPDLVVSVFESLPYDQQGAADYLLENLNEITSFVLVSRLIKRPQHSQIVSILTRLRAKLDLDRLKSILRWLAASDSEVAAYATISLVNLGQPMSPLFAHAVSGGTHEGGYVEKAGELLEVFVKGQGEAGINWLIEEMSNHEAHATHWRILLDVLLDSDRDRSDALAGLLTKLDEYTLPRHPEIRTRFGKLVQRTEYRLVLDHALRSINRLRRFNAASIIIAADPRNSYKALQSLLHSLGNGTRTNELYRLILKLDIPRGLVEQILAEIDSYSDAAQSFILLLSYHHGIQLIDDKIRELVINLLQSHYFLDYPHPFATDGTPELLRQEKAFPFLVEELNGNLKQEAAKRLLWHFQENLSPAQIACCHLLILNENQNGLWTYNFENAVAFLNANPEVMNDPQVVTLLSSFPMVRELLEPTGNMELWDRFVWQTFVDYRLTHENESFVFWIVRFCEIHPIVKEAITAPILRLLSDARLDSTYHGQLFKAYLPLLVANELGFISSDGLRPFLERTRSQRQETLSDWVRAIWKRAGQLPTTNSGVPVTVQVSSVVPTLFEIFDSRLGYHPRIKIMVEQALMGKEHFDLDVIAGLSDNGAAFSLIISFCTGSDSVPFMKRAKLILSPVQNDTGAGMIFISTRNIISSILFDKEQTQRYMSLLLQNIEDLSMPHVADIMIFANLSDEELHQVLCATLELTRYRVPEGFLPLFSSFVVRSAASNPEPIGQMIQSGSEKFGNELQSHDQFGDVDSCWFFGIASLWLKKECDDLTVRLILAGLRGAFYLQSSPPYQPRIENLPIVRLINSTYPLFSQIDPALFSRVLQLGMEADDADIQSLCRLLYYCSNPANLPKQDD